MQSFNDEYTSRRPTDTSRRPITDQQQHIQQHLQATLHLGVYPSMSTVLVGYQRRVGVTSQASFAET